MAKKRKAHTERDQANHSPNGRPASLGIARKGIRTGRDFANLMSALMTDLIEGKISPGIGNAACNAGGKLLKVVEMQQKYGQAGPGSGEKTLLLSGADEKKPDLPAVQ